MPQGNEYRKKVYSALKGELGESFSKSEEDFNKALDNEPQYRKKVYSALKGELGDSFNKTEDEFYSLLSAGGGSMGKSEPSSEPSEQPPKLTAPKYVWGESQPKVELAKPTAQDIYIETAEAQPKIAKSSADDLAKEEKAKQVESERRQELGSQFQEYTIPEMEERTKQSKELVDEANNQTKDFIDNSIIPLKDSLDRLIFEGKEAGIVRVDEEGKTIIDDQELYDKVVSIQGQLRDAEDAFGYYESIRQNALGDYEQKLLEEDGRKALEGGWLGVTWNTLLQRTGESSAGIMEAFMPVIAAMLPEEARGGMGIMEASAQASKDLAPDVRVGLKELAGLDSTTDEYIEEFNKSFLGQAYTGTIGSLPAMVTSRTPILLFGQGFDSMQQSVENTDLSPEEKYAYSAIGAAATTALEKFGIDAMMGKNPLVKKLTNDYLRYAAQAGEKATVKNINRWMANVGVRGLAEGATEALQKGEETLQQVVVNELKDKEVFDVGTVREEVNEILYDGALGLAGGLAMSTLISAYQATRGNKLDPTTFEISERIARDPEYLSKLDVILSLKVESGDITPEQKQQYTQEATDAVESISQIDETLPAKERQRAFEALVKKKNLEREMEGKAVVNPQKVTELNKIDEELKEISTPREELQDQDGRTAQRTEVQKKTPEQEVDDYVRERASGVRVEMGIGDIEQRIDNAEYVNEQEIFDAQEKLLEESERVENSNYSPEAKATIQDALNDLYNKLDSYEFRTKTETKEYAERTATRRPIEAKREQRKTPQERITGRKIRRIEGDDFSATVENIQDTQKGVTKKPTKGAREEVTVIEETDDGIIIQSYDSKGEKITAQKTTAESMNDFELVETIKDENGIVTGAILRNKNNDSEAFAIDDADLALDLAIEKNQADLGKVTQEEFTTAVEQVETPIKPESDALQQISGKTEESVLRDERVEETSPKELQETQDDTKPPNAKAVKEASKSIADGLRNAKFVKNPSKLKTLRSDPTALFQAAWDSTIEATALTIEAGGTIAQAINDGVNALRESDWYKGLSDKGKKQAESITKKELGKEARAQRNTVKKELQENRKKAVNRLKSVGDKLKNGSYTNQSDVVGAFFDKAKSALRLANPELTKKIAEQATKLSRGRVADVDFVDVIELNKEIDKALDSQQENVTPVQRRVTNLKQRAKNVNSVGKAIAFDAEVESILNQLESDLESGEITETVYNTQLEKMAEIEDDFSLKDINSLGLISRAKGDLTRAKNKVNSALESGEISAEKAKSLLEGIDKAAKEYEVKVAEITKDLNKEASEIKKRITTNYLKNVLGLTPEQYDYVRKFLKVGNIADPVLADSRLKVLEQLEQGYVPMKSIFDITRLESAKKAGNEIATVFDKAAMRRMRDRNEASILRELSFEDVAFRSSLFGKEVADSGVLEKYIYYPIQQAVQRAKDSMTEMAREYDSMVFKNLKDRLRATYTPRAFRAAANRAGVFRMYQRAHSLLGEDIKRGVMIDGSVDKSKLRVGEVDELGIILGKKEALDDAGDSLDPKTRKKLENGDLRKKYNSATQKLLDEIWQSLPKKENGAVDVEVVATRTGDFATQIEMNMLDAYDVASDKAYDMFEATNQALGLPIERQQGKYMKFDRVIANNKETDPLSESEKIKPKMIAGSSKLKTTEAISALEFNINNLAIKNMKEAAIYSELYPALKQSRANINQAIKDNETATNILRAISEDLEESIKFEYGSSASAMSNIVGAVLGARYAMSLSNPIRGIYETTATGTRVFIQNPKKFAEGVKAFRNNSDKVVDKMIENGVALSIAEQSGQIEAASSTTGVSKTGKGLGAAKTSAGKTWFTPAQKAAQEIMLMPEKALSKLVFYPEFLAKFKSITGEDFNQEEYLNNPEYAEQFKDEVNDAAAQAQQSLFEIFGTGSKFGSRRRIRIAPMTSRSFRADSAEGRIASFFGNFVYREGSVMRRAARYLADAYLDDGISGAMEVSKGQLGNVTGVMSNAVSYSIMSALYWSLFNLALAELGGDDEKEKKAMKDMGELAGFDEKGNWSAGRMVKNLTTEQILPQAAYLGLGRYGQLGRGAGLLISNALYHLSDDKKTKKVYEDIIKKNFFQSPIGKRKEDLYVQVGKAIPVADMLVRTLDSSLKLYERIENNKNWDSTDEKALMTLAIGMHLVNMALITRGTQIPMGREIQRVIETKTPRKKKRKGGNSKLSPKK